MKSTGKIFFCVSDPQLGQQIDNSLKSESKVEVCRFNSLDEARVGLEKSKYDLCLIDAAMEGVKSAALRSHAHTQGAAIVYFGKETPVKQVVTCYEEGCDEFIRLPMDMQELAMRIKALLRRRSSFQLTPDTYRLGKYTFDSAHKKLTSRDETISLTTRENELLSLLCEHANQTLDRDIAFEEIWGTSSEALKTPGRKTDPIRRLDVYVNKLRKLIEREPSVQIQNIHGRGYRLTTEKGRKKGKQITL